MRRNKISIFFLLACALSYISAPTFANSSEIKTSKSKKQLTKKKVEVDKKKPTKVNRKESKKVAIKKSNKAQSNKVVKRKSENRKIILAKSKANNKKQVNKNHVVAKQSKSSNEKVNVENYKVVSKSSRDVGHALIKPLSKSNKVKLEDESQENIVRFSSINNLNQSLTEQYSLNYLDPTYNVTSFEDSNKYFDFNSSMKEINFKSDNKFVDNSLNKDFDFFKITENGKYSLRWKLDIDQNKQNKYSSEEEKNDDFDLKNMISGVKFKLKINNVNFLN